MARLLLTEILDEAQGLLVRTFNRNELRQLLFAKMQIDLDEIAPHATGTKDLVFEVLTWMDRRGVVHDLIRVAAENRASVPEWKSLYERLSGGNTPTAGPAPQSAAGSQSRMIPEEVKALIRGYLRLGRVLPEGDQKTVQLQRIVNDLLAVPLDEYDSAARFHLSGCGGERLVAVLALVRRPDAQFLRWLAERVAVEKHFVGYQAATALKAAAEALSLADLDAVAACVEAAKDWIPQEERQRGRWRKLAETLDVVARRSARPSGSDSSHGAHRP